MGTYADSLLTQGEVVIRRERQHWLSLFLETRLAILGWIIAIVVLVIAFKNSGGVRDGLSLGALAIIILGLVFFGYRFWHWRTDEYVITNRRLLKVEGIINKRSGDSNLEKINDAILEENLVGRILDYGDLEILTAAEVSVDRYRMLNHAKTFKKEMMTAKHALEDGRSYHDVASAPLQASEAAPTTRRDTAATERADTASAPLQATGPATAVRPDTAATERADTPEEISQSLARLAALRDSGAITAADYDAKKQELLGRL